jgi:4a-hydroxytetrahydrobiopterin dehydratase
MASIALSDERISQALSRLKAWEREGDTLVKTFKLDSYMAGLAFASALGTIAEGFDHHPDLHIGYKKVRVVFTTHDAGNKISQKDVDVALAIDALPYPRV